MTPEAINEAIYKTCVGLEKRSRAPRVFEVSESRLFLELTRCMLSSQVRYRTALLYAEKLENSGLLKKLVQGKTNSRVRRQIAAELGQELCDSRGQKPLRYRFPNLRAKFLAHMARQIYAGRGSLEELVGGGASPVAARKILVDTCMGIGPKQASLFLRNIGTGQDMAVLDTHIIWYMRECWGREIDPLAVSTLTRYEQWEGVFRQIARYFGFEVATVDLAIWGTVRVIRRGAGTHEHGKSSFGRHGFHTSGSSKSRESNKTVPAVY